DFEAPQPVHRRPNAAVAAVVGAIVVGLFFAAWISHSRFRRMSNELDQTKLLLAAANQEADLMRTELSRASVVHELWGLGSRFAARSAAACSAEDDHRR